MEFPNHRPRRRGRPRLWRKKRSRRTTIHITREDLVYLKGVGDGNVSAGVRQLILRDVTARRAFQEYEDG